MPNHITNILTVKGPNADIERFRKSVETTEMDNKKRIFKFAFEGTLPMPKELEETTSPPQTPSEKKLQEQNIKKYGAGNWYDWKCKYWGTKWGAYHAESPEKIEGGMIYRFDTAWAPPFAWFITTSKMFPRLHFKDWWKDEGGGAGLLEIKNMVPTMTTMSDHDWLLEFDEAYKEEYEFIIKGKYKEVIEKYTKEENELCFSELAPHLLKRIKDKDLPLFIGVELYGQEDELERRIRNMKGK